MDINRLLNPIPTTKKQIYPSPMSEYSYITKGLYSPNSIARPINSSNYSDQKQKSTSSPITLITPSLFTPLPFVPVGRSNAVYYNPPENMPTHSSPSYSSPLEANNKRSTSSVRRNRSKLSDEVLALFKNEFSFNKFPNAGKRETLSVATGIPPKVIQSKHFYLILYSFIFY